MKRCTYIQSCLQLLLPKTQTNQCRKGNSWMVPQLKTVLIRWDPDQFSRTEKHWFNRHSRGTCVPPRFPLYPCCCSSTSSTCTWTKTCSWILDTSGQQACPVQAESTANGFTIRLTVPVCNRSRYKFKKDWTNKITHQSLNSWLTQPKIHSRSQSKACVAVWQTLLVTATFYLLRNLNHNILFL